MENKKDEKRLSSGAEKVETIAARAEAKANGVAKKSPSAKNKEKEKKEKARAKKRVEAALLKEERKTKKAKML